MLVNTVPTVPELYDEWSIPALLRSARRAYGAAIRESLAAAGYDDVPANGSYVIGGVATGDVALSEVIARMGMSKQAAGQLVDTLVARGYLDRAVDPTDRRRLTVSMTPRGAGAAAAIGRAVQDVDAELERRVGQRRIASARRTLEALADLATEPVAGRARGDHDG